MIPLARLTSVIMPHHGETSTLRPRIAQKGKELAMNQSSAGLDLRKWTAIKILKYGLEKKSARKKGWLFELLTKEGNIK